MAQGIFFNISAIKKSLNFINLFSSEILLYYLGPFRPEFVRAPLVIDGYRVYLETWCGCGQPEEAAAALLRLLRLHPLYEHREEFEAWIPDSGVEMLLLYQLDRDGLTEHGGNVGGAWLTAKGEAVREALIREEADEFATLFDEHCACGYDIDDLTRVCQSGPCPTLAART